MPHARRGMAGFHVRRIAAGEASGTGRAEVIHDDCEFHATSLAHAFVFCAPAFIAAIHMSSRLEHIAPRAGRVRHFSVDAVFTGRMIRRTRRRTRRDYALQFRAGFNSIAHRSVHGCSRSRESAFSFSRLAFSSSRTVSAMTRDGLLPRFTKVWRCLFITVTRHCCAP